MPAPERLGQYACSGVERELFYLDLERPAELPDRLGLPSPHFVAMIAWSSANEDVASISRVIARLLEDGCVSFGFWGGGEERAHDIADEVILFGDGEEPVFQPDDAPLILTCWDDELDEALFWHLFCSTPDDVFVETTRAAIVIRIDGRSEASEARIRGALADPHHFIDEVTGDADDTRSESPSPWVVRGTFVLLLALGTSCSAQLLAIQGVGFTTTFPLVWTAPFVELPGPSLAAATLILVGLLGAATRPGQALGCLGVLGWVLLGLMSVGLYIT